MPTIDYNKNKQVIAELDLLLLEMWFLSNLKNKKIKFNPEPILNFFNVTNKQALPKREKFVDLHFEIAKKVDALIAKYESELITGEPEMISKIHQDIPSPNIIEKREPSIIRQPEIPVFHTENMQNISFGEFKQGDDLFEIVEPPEFIPVEDKPQDDAETSESFMLGDQDKSKLKLLSVLGRIKVRNTDTTKQKNVKIEKPKKQTEKSETTKTKFNDLSIKKDELEKTREEIEARKQALKKAMEKEKTKKLELKKQKAEKKKAEKLKKLELKRLAKEKKIQELKKLKEEKQKQIEREKEDKLKAKIIKEKEIAEKLKVDKKEEKSIKEKKVTTKIKKETPTGMETFVKRRQEIKNQYDKDVEKLIPIIDGLLENLPDDVIDNFAHSKDYVLYEKVVSKYKHM